MKPVTIGEVYDWIIETTWQSEKPIWRKIAGKQYSYHPLYRRAVSVELFATCTPGVDSLCFIMVIDSYATKAEIIDLVNHQNDKLTNFTDGLNLVREFAEDIQIWLEAPLHYE